MTSLRVESGPGLCSYISEISSSPQVLALAGHLSWSSIGKIFLTDKQITRFKQPFMAFVSCYNPDSTNEQSTFYNDRIRKETINALKIYSKLFLEHKGML